MEHITDAIRILRRQRVLLDAELAALYGVGTKRLHEQVKRTAFTEHGAMMAAMVLSSPRAMEVSVYVVRAFVKLRETLSLSAN